MSLAGLNILGQGLTALFTSCGGHLREQWGGRQTIIYCTFITNMSYALLPDQFWLVAMWTVWNSIMNGLSAASNFALSMDCLSVGSDGRSSNAARDRAIQATHRVIPTAFLPAVVGWGFFSHFSSVATAYRWAFALSNMLNLVSTAVFYLAVHPLEEPLDKPCQCFAPLLREVRICSLTVNLPECIVSYPANKLRGQYI